MNAAYIVDAIRTPIGSFTGSLAPVRADDLAAHVIKALVDRHPGLDQAAIDDVILGCANQAGEDNRNVARMAVLLAGLAGDRSRRNSEPLMCLRNERGGAGRTCHRREQWRPFHRGGRGAHDARSLGDEQDQHAVWP
jgi:hypothetical protein